MILTFLGTGTSAGVPQMRCACEVCRSADPHDKRLRASAMLQLCDADPAILIDCGPDFREQMLRHNSPDLCCALLTHSHYDHVGGIDDLRPYAYRMPDEHFPLYCRADVDEDLRNRIPYCFREHPYPGVPQFNMNIIKPGDIFEINTGTAVAQVRALEIIHGQLPILGYRIGPFAYITDASEVPADTIEALRGVDTLVINALRHEKHPSHLNLSQALDVIKETAPRRAFLTHMCDRMGLHSHINGTLPENVQLAFDGLKVVIPDI